jgi:hypothetical protein
VVGWELAAMPLSPGWVFSVDIRNLLETESHGGRAWTGVVDDKWLKIREIEIENSCEWRIINVWNRVSR